MRLGSYIFIRIVENIYFDILIFIMNLDVENDIIIIVVEIKGIKVVKLLDIKIGGSIIICGFYWNGVFGVKNIFDKKNNKVLIFVRGIGLVFMIFVVRKLIL